MAVGAAKEAAGSLEVGLKPEGWGPARPHARSAEGWSPCRSCHTRPTRTDSTPRANQAPAGTASKKVRTSVLPDCARILPGPVSSR